MLLHPLFLELLSGGGLKLLGGLAVFLFVVVLGFLFFFYGSLWFQGYMSGAQVSLFRLFCMSLKQVRAKDIVLARIMLKQTGLPISGKEGITIQRMEAHVLAGGNILNVVKSIIAAHKANISLTFDQAAAIDLAGRDVVRAVNTSVNPTVIVCPDPRKGKTTLSAIARNGVELRVRAQVTVRTNLEQLIGGATEDTIIARIGEGIITAIGSANTHTDVMETPDSISRQVLNRGLDAQTAFQIVSIDIADIVVGDNIGARLQQDQANADMRVAKAQAEELLALAKAVEQENRATVAENQARVVEAEAKVPMAMAEAFRNGRFV